MAVKRPYDRVRSLCLALPRVYEKEAWGAPTFRMEGGKMFLMFADDHHGDGRTAIWLMASPDARETLLEADPDVYFIPPYVGPSGWLGVCIDGKVDWATVAELVEHAARLGSKVMGSKVMGSRAAKGTGPRKAPARKRRK